jgi:8-oxo-dGTP pyrophosphatase MutT (NUDIX family)
MVNNETHFLGQVAQKVLIERDGKFLFLRYPSHDVRVAGCYDIPGGRLNEGEAPLDGLRREVFEEVGAQINNL